MSTGTGTEPTTAPPALVTLHVWGVPGRQVPAAVARMALDRAPLRHTAGLRFAKLLGTGTAQRFSLRDANPRRWAVLGAWDTTIAAEAFEHSAIAAAWSRIATETWRIDLRPLRSRGRWAGRQPFGHPPGGSSANRRPGAPVAALTRARLRPRRAVTFRRAVPPVSAELATASGLRFAMGIGESPIGLQGTFSLWRDNAALTRYAYSGPAHLEAIRRTGEVGWYAEELFARFEVLGTRGTVAGRDPLA